MEYCDLGNTGIKVSRLGFGAMRLPMKDDHVDMEPAVEMMQRAFDLGVNLVDTAFGYCREESQVAVGKAVKGRRGHVYLSTKNPYKEASGAEWRKRLDLSLERLDEDCIDLYNFHSLSWEAFQEYIIQPGGPLEAARKAQDEGLFRHLGLSCHDAPENMMKLIDTGEFECIILQYNLLDRLNEDAIRYAHEKGLGVVVMGPVGGGRLVRDSEVLQRLIPDRTKSTPETALRFVFSNPCVSSALSGMRAVEQVEDNVVTASIAEPLDREARKRVQEMLDENRRLAELYCTGCGYCMPCPNEVNIPENFTIMNYHRVYGLEGLARVMYRRLGTELSAVGPPNKKAADCEECGECEPKCPQGIPIMDQLKEMASVIGENQGNKGSEISGERDG